jgi:hypothetical protein
MANNTYLYAAPHKKLDKFKIGFSGDVGRRLKQIGEPIEWSDGYVVACEGRDAVRIESILHKLFDAFRLKEESYSDGHTEWFDKKCLSDVKKFIEDNQALLRYKRIEELDRHKKEKAAYNPARKSRRLSFVEVEERNLLALSRFKRWVSLHTTTQSGEMEPVFRRVYLARNVPMISSVALVLEFSNSNVTSRRLDHVFRATDESLGPTLPVLFAKDGTAHIVGSYSFDADAGQFVSAAAREHRQLELNLQLHPRLVLPIQYGGLTAKRVPGINDIRGFFESYECKKESIC